MSLSVWSVLQDDGTVLVLYSSTTHHKCRPQPRAWWQWFAPIRASVRCVLLVVTTAGCHALRLAWDRANGLVLPKESKGSHVHKSQVYSQQSAALSHTVYTLHLIRRQCCSADQQNKHRVRRSRPGTLSAP